LAPEDKTPMEKVLVAGTVMHTYAIRLQTAPHGYEAGFLGDLKPTFGWQISNRVIEQAQ
jgi:hypothetical protein